MALVFAAFQGFGFASAPELDGIPVFDDGITAGTDHFDALRGECPVAAGLVGKIISDPFPGLAQLFTAYLVAQLAKDPNEPRIRPVTGEDLLGLQKSVPETPINQEIPVTSDKSVLVAA